jgi:hypothetical protein
MYERPKLFSNHFFLKKIGASQKKMIEKSRDTSSSNWKELFPVIISLRKFGAHYYDYY